MMFSVVNQMFFSAQFFPPKLPSIALMGHCVWLVDLWTVLVGWRSVSMDCGGQCVTMDGVTVMLELCADSWGTVLTHQVEYFLS